jgi:uncharacterized protein YxjI
MKDFQFPLQFVFRISSIANDFKAIDPQGKMVAYVKQKLFKFKEDISIYADDSQTTVNYRIKADRWLDFSAAYTFYDNKGVEIGKIVRKGWRSLWKAQYEILDQNHQVKFHINEENGWVKVMDSLLGEVPIVNIFTGYFFNPTYLITDDVNQNVARLSKERSFWGKQFNLTKLSQLEGHEDDNIVLGCMMMVLLERRRG